MVLVVQRLSLGLAAVEMTAVEMIVVGNPVLGLAVGAIQDSEHHQTR